MPGMGRGRARIVRGLLMSTACLFLPSTAHVAAGGAVPAHPGFLLVAVLLSVACVGLADRRRSPGEIAALLLFSQPLLHVLLVLAQHDHPAGAVVPGASMLVAHSLAAGVLTVLLAGAEAVAWSLASLSATVLLSLVRHLLRLPAADDATPGPRRQTEEVCSPHVVHLVRSNPWRGPPAPARA